MKNNCIVQDSFRKKIYKLTGCQEGEVSFIYDEDKGWLWYYKNKEDEK